MNKFASILFLFLLLITSCETPLEEILDDNSEPTLKELWRVYTPTEASTYPPTYSDGIIYSTVGTHAIHAYKSRTGELVWIFNPDSVYNTGGSHTRIIIKEDKLFTVIQAKMYCLDKKTANVLYTYNHIQDRGVTVDDKQVYITSQYNDIYAADIETGTINWRGKLPARLVDPPGIDGDYLYYAVGGVTLQRDIGYLIKVNKYIGEQVYSIVVKMPEDEMIPRGPCETPVFYNNLVIIENGDAGQKGSRFYAFNKDTGEIVWTYYYHGGAIRSALTIENGILYVATQGTDAFALRAETGELVWKTDIQGSSTKGPVVFYKDYLIFATAAYMYFLNKHSGEIYFKQENIWVPITHNDTLFTGAFIWPPPEEGYSNYLIAYLIKD